MSQTPQRYQNAKYEAVLPEIKALFEKMPKTRRGIYIHGPVGSGKTHMAWALKEKWDKPDKTHIRISKFWNITELLYTIRRDFDLSPIDRSHEAEKLLEYNGLLFLDDIGAEKMTEWVAETFYLILNKRYEKMIPTVFTSNLPVAQLAERVGDRVASRIIEMCDVVEITSGDRRLKKLNKIKI